MEAPAGVKTAPIESVLYELPPALVDLALWVADYYGSTPARALELVAPKLRARRGERRMTGAGMAGEAEPDELTEPQQRAVARIVEALDGDAAHLLLAGATGSGKTEVYLQACAAALERGRGAIVLVPEIALTPQTLGRFQARFGDRIAVLHSGLTDAERRDERERIVAGEAPVVVGARSAVFAPVPNLGLICVDEEHDSSYKQESDPALRRAHGRGQAGRARGRGRRLRQRDAAAGELGGARAARARRAPRRPDADGAGSSTCAARRATRSRRRCWRSSASSPSTAARRILLLNRRGLAPAIHCRACGLSRRCGLCDVSLTLHGDARLHCHHCGYSEAVPEACPACGSSELARIGAGTQRLEARARASASPSSSGSGSTRTRPPSRARSARRSTASPPPTAPC